MSYKDGWEVTGFSFKEDRKETQSLYEFITMDLHPKCWLSPVKETSVGYMLIMFGLYMGLTRSLSLLVDGIIYLIDPHYTIPETVYSLVELASAGPLEDTIFWDSSICLW